MKKSRSEGDASAFARPSSTQNLSKTISANYVSSAGPSSAAIHATTALDMRLGSYGVAKFINFSLANHDLSTFSLFQSF